MMLGEFMSLAVRVCGLSLVLFCGAAWGQDIWSSPEVTSACGPRDVKLAVRTDSSHPAIQPAENGDAILYVIQDLPQVPSVISTITRVGVDGQWVGASQNRSHFSIALKPGVHHVCVSGQWSKLISTDSIALKRVEAKSGTIYYLRVRFLFPGAGGRFLGLEPVDEDEGRFLVETSDSSISHTK
jgi:hypothetical protein